MNNIHAIWETISPRRPRRSDACFEKNEDSVMYWLDSGDCMLLANSDGKSLSPEVASENLEQSDRQLLSSSASQSSQRLLTAYNLAEITASNQAEQRYDSLSLFWFFVKHVFADAVMALMAL